MSCEAQVKWQCISIKTRAITEAYRILRFVSPPNLIGMIPLNELFCNCLQCTDFRIDSDGACNSAQTYELKLSLHAELDSSQRKCSEKSKLKIEWEKVHMSTLKVNTHWKHFSQHWIKKNWGHTVQLAPQGLRWLPVWCLGADCCIGTWNSIIFTLQKNMWWEVLTNTHQD